MGKASSSKKVARAARAGGGRRAGQRRNIGFPLVCGLVIVLGVALVFFSRDQREASASPKANSDHWHAAYGVYICDKFANPIVSQNDPLGIHTHGDGVIHIHPFLNSSSGTNARLGIFLDTVGAKVTDKAIELPDGTKVEEGKDDCDGKKAIVQVARWKSADAAEKGEKPTEIIKDDFSRIRFRGDREAYTIAFLPDGTDIPPPDSIPTLDNLSDVGTTATSTGTNTSSTDTTGTSDTSDTTDTTDSTGSSSTETTITDTSTSTSTP